MLLGRAHQLKKIIKRRSEIKQVQISGRCPPPGAGRGYFQLLMEEAKLWLYASKTTTTQIFIVMMLIKELILIHQSMQHHNT